MDFVKALDIINKLHGPENILFRRDEFRLSRIRSCIYAYKLGINYLLYSGTKKTNVTAAFCNERVGKVFTVEEIKLWSTPKDCPYSDYNVFMDMGCNCQVEYCSCNWAPITKEVATAMRPDLAAIETTGVQPSDLIVQVDLLIKLYTQYSNRVEL